MFKNDPVNYPIKCQDALDSNDDGDLNAADATYLLDYLFRSGQKPKAPFPSAGTDPTADNLRCEKGL